MQPYHLSQVMNQPQTNAHPQITMVVDVTRHGNIHPEPCAQSPTALIYIQHAYVYDSGLATSCTRTCMIKYVPVPESILACLLAADSSILSLGMPLATALAIPPSSSTCMEVMLSPGIHTKRWVMKYPPSKLSGISLQITGLHAMSIIFASDQVGFH